MRKKEAADTPEARRAKIRKELREWASALGIALVIVIVVHTFLFRLNRVEGASMRPTLVNGERVFATVLDRKLFGVERGDIVLCHYPGHGSMTVVKRVLGLPGDLVERKDGVTFIAGTAIDEVTTETSGSSFAAVPAYALLADYSYTLGPDEYFCVGDNLTDSVDSRYWQDETLAGDNLVGPIPGGSIVAKVRCVIWPLSRIRTVD